MDGKGVNRDLRLVLGEAFWNEVKLTINGQMFRKIGKENLRRTEILTQPPENGAPTQRAHEHGQWFHRRAPIQSQFSHL